MGVDSPAEYVASLEREVKGLKARLASVERDLKESDEIRAALIEAAAQAAQITERAIARVEKNEPVVKHAYELMQACARSDREAGDRACRELINAVLEHQRSQPS